ncbi:hypothetical protein Ae201684P_013725 [Aphanomyces euteiches]|nr:hypothetical protein Ae201684P_013725 [Aphanomyces euteiches]
MAVMGILPNGCHRGNPSLRWVISTFAVYHEDLRPKLDVTWPPSVTIVPPTPSTFMRHISPSTKTPTLRSYVDSTLVDVDRRDLPKLVRMARRQYIRQDKDDKESEDAA